MRERERSKAVQRREEEEEGGGVGSKTAERECESFPGKCPRHVMAGIEKV